MINRSPVTDAELQLIREATLAGRFAKDVAAELGRSVCVIERLIRHLRDIGELPESKRSLAHAAKIAQQAGPEIDPTREEIEAICREFRRHKLPVGQRECQTVELGRVPLHSGAYRVIGGTRYLV